MKTQSHKGLSCAILNLKTVYVVRKQISQHKQIKKRQDNEPNTVRHRATKDYYAQSWIKKNKFMLYANTKTSIYKQIKKRQDKEANTGRPRATNNYYVRSWINNFCFMLYAKQ